jgi:hypothetical protein
MIILNARRAFLQMRLGILMLAGVLCTAAIGFFYFRFAMPSPTAAEVGHTFLQFKLAKWASPFVFVLLGISAVTLANKVRWGAAWAIPPLLALTILGGITTYRAIIEDARRIAAEIGQSEMPFAELLALRRQATFIPPDQTIYLDIGLHHGKLRQALVYVLNDKRLASDWRDDGYLLGSLPKGQDVQPIEDAQWIIYRASPQDLIHSLPVVNQLIFRRRPNAVFAFQGSSGGWGIESDKLNWWEWVNQTAKYRFNILGSANRVRVGFSFMAASEPFSLTAVIWSGSDDSQEEVGRFNFNPKLNWSEIELPPVAIKGRNLTIELISNTAPVQLGRGDSRVVSFQVKDIEVSDASE